MIKTLVYQVKVEDQEKFEKALERLTMFGTLIDYELIEEIEDEDEYFND